MAGAGQSAQGATNRSRRKPLENKAARKVAAVDMEACGLGRYCRVNHDLPGLRIG
jgi:hypothetical protein